MSAATAASRARTARAAGLTSSAAPPHQGRSMTSSDLFGGAPSAGGAPVDREEVCFVAETCAKAELYEKMSAEIELLVADLPRQREQRTTTSFPPTVYSRAAVNRYRCGWQGRRISSRRSASCCSPRGKGSSRRSGSRGRPSPSRCSIYAAAKRGGACPNSSVYCSCFACFLALCGSSGSLWRL